ncbi:MAG TPA: hypothetical protein VGF15_02870 [Solirubrobacteraceae bacterium]
MPIDQHKTIRGAVAGALAAGVSAAQMPLDKRLFASDFDDVEMLGKALTQGSSWPILGWAWHLQNGAMFGAIYANLAPRLPLPSWARGPLLAVLENFLSWPLVAVSDRLHPAREQLGKSFANPRALAQATWRHLLFGILLGELERTLNKPSPVEMPAYEQVISSNGHGKLEHATTIG